MRHRGIADRHAMGRALLLRHAVVILFFAFVSGCSLQPTYERPSAPVAAAYPEGEAYKEEPATTGKANPPAVDIGWRDFLTDSRLQRLVAIALANNRDLRVAVLKVAEVQAQYRIQRAAQFPHVSGFASAERTRTPGSLSATGRATVSSGYSVGLAASWEIDFFGRLQSLSDVALQQYFASVQARKAAEILLVSQVADQYLTMLAFDEQLAVTQRTLETARGSYQIVKLQFDTGTGAELALRQAETVVEQAQATYAAQVRARAQAENGLVLLLGQPVPADLPPPVRLDAQQILADIPAGLPSDLLTRRPDIMQAEATLRGANANIGAARAAFFPRITLTGDFGAASSALGALFKGGSAAWSLLPALTVPIFDAGANQANLDVAKIEKDVDIAQYQKSIQTAFREVADGLAARGTYDDQVAALVRDTAAEQRSLELADLRYRSGVDSYLAVLTAQTNLYNAQLALVATRLQRLSNLVDLYRTLGGGWIERTGDEPRAPDAGIEGVSSRSTPYGG